MVVVFDIDGTLTRSSVIDGKVYAETFTSVFGISLPSSDWAEYAAVSDQGIAMEALERLGLNLSRVPDFKERFVAALRQRLSELPIEPVPGARTILQELMRVGHEVALATGAWADAARLKLSSAGVDATGCPLVGSDHAPRRQDIIRAVLSRTRSHERAVYVGDAPWDVFATRVLTLPFVGIDAEGTGQLAALGVKYIFSGYQNAGAFFEALARADVPALI